ncbi:MAG: hypothetical protein ACLUW6_04505 [Coriobacteriaceae bacterium]
MTDFAQEWTATRWSAATASLASRLPRAGRAKKVILIEKQPEDFYQAVGNELPR